jgi:hypothetical protein
MERFIQMLEENPLRDELTLAIDGRGAFRRFKDVLMVNPPERERWFAFRSERLRVFMEAWLEAHSLIAVPRAAGRPSISTEPQSEAPLSQDQLSGRRVRNAEALRRQLQDLASGLGARDLDRVLTFAEFVKARRVARSYSQRHEAGSGDARTSDSASPSSGPPAPDDEASGASDERGSS